jgi:hypothetical protein
VLSRAFFLTENLQSFAMSQRAASDVVRLYRELLRVARRWPVDPSKGERNMKPQIRSNIRSAFREPAQASDVPAKVANGKRELAAFRELLDGTLDKKVERSFLLVSRLLTRVCAHAAVPA